MLTRCNEALLRAASEEALFADVCKLIVTVGGYRMCWTGVAEHDAGKTVRPVASYGQDDGYLARARITWGDEVNGRGPTGSALRLGRPVLAHDFDQDPALAPWRDAALARGYRSASALPLLDGEQRIGVITMYAGEPHAFDDEEVQFLQQLAADVAYGVRALRARAARDRAEQALADAHRLESIGRLAGGVAHDFNNVLTVVFSCCEDLLDGLGPTHPLRESANDILSAAGRARDLTRQLLAIARRQPVSPVAVDLTDVVQRGQPLLRRLMGTDVAIVPTLQASVWPIRADPAQLEQVLLNLAVNARDAMPDRGTLTLQTDNVVLSQHEPAAFGEVPPGEYVRLTVRDTGAGMPERVRARLFEPFFTTKPKGKGTGLGLAIVYGIVKQCGGHIRVDSAEGVGTTFELYFPRIDRR